MKSKIRNALCLAVSLTMLRAQAEIASPDTNLSARENEIIAAAQPSSSPAFNGAHLAGIWPGTPLLFPLAGSGDQPIQFSARHLPAGLALNPTNGVITGQLNDARKYEFKVTARNSSGEATADLTLVAGAQLALTPPMGWNSYDAYGDSVVESEVLAKAEWLKKHLQPYGWDTVIVDFRWYDTLADGQRVQDPEGVQIDSFGRCVPATNRFPSAINGAGFGPLAAKIHALGLKFGIHIMRGIPRRAVDQNLPIDGSNFTAAQAVRSPDEINRTCVWNRDMYGVAGDSPAGRAWYASVARQYAAWGVDYIKCDDIANLQRGKLYDAGEITALADALRGSGRSIILSLSPGATPVDAGPHLVAHANLWRISGDFWDRWPALNENFDLFAAWYGDGGPGHWPDGDMIPFGHLCQRNCDVHPERWTRFTRDEQLTLMSLWALAPSPLMLGMNLLDNDDWTTALLSNPEVLALNQDAAGHSARRRFGSEPNSEVWVKQLSNGVWAAGFFNRTDKPVSVNFPWQNLGFNSPPAVRDLWLRRDLGWQTVFTATIPPHGCYLLQLNSLSK